MEITILQDLAIIFTLSLLVLQGCALIRLPAIVGFLITGILAGPHGLALAAGVHEVEIMAEIGVVLLLFAIGLEFSFRDLLRMQKAVLLGGGLQVLLTIGLMTGLVSGLLGQALNQGIFVGFLIALSSTAIVLKLYQERAEIETIHGQAVLSILIFQDIVVVLMMLLLPLLAGASVIPLGRSLLILGGRGIATVVLVLFCSRYVVPTFLYRIANMRNREVFLLAVVVICLLTAWLTSLIGLSLGLGAFLAGLVIAESEYSHAALGNILPFRDLFMSLFFVSIGMLLDFRILITQPLTVLGLFAVILICKLLVLLPVTLALGLPLRNAVLTSLALCQIGEFSFILSKTGMNYGFLGGDRYQIFLEAAVISMGLTPFLVALAPWLADLAERLPLPARLKTGLAPVATADGNGSHGKSNHLVIIGYGLNGRHLARAAKVSAIDYVIIEANPDTVRQERAKGEPILYGDAAHKAMLHHAGIERARTAVIAIPDPVATRRAAQLIRRLNPAIFLIVRTRMLAEVEELRRLGADLVIPAEFETAVEIFTQVLNHYLVPQQDIEKFVAEIRAGGYRMFRSLSQTLSTVSGVEEAMPDAEIKVLRLREEGELAGKTIGQVHLRRNYGVTLLVIRRQGRTITDPGADTLLKGNDTLVLFGPREKFPPVMALL